MNLGILVDLIIMSIQNISLCKVIIKDILEWTDAFLCFNLCLAHPECRTPLFKYMHTIILGASLAKVLGWRDYDIQFRLKKECTPAMLFASFYIWLSSLLPRSKGSVRRWKPLTSVLIAAGSYAGCQHRNSFWESWRFVCAFITSYS